MAIVTVGKLRGYLDPFISFLKLVKGREESTVVSYRTDVSQFLEFLSESRLSLSMKTGQAYLDYLNRTSQTRLAEATKSRKLSSLRAFLRYLHSQGVVTKRVAKSVPTVAVKKKDRKLTDFRALEQLISSLAGNNSPRGRRDYAMLCLLIDSGMRVSELCALDESNVDLERPSVTCAGRGGRVRILLLEGSTVQSLKLYRWIGRPRLLGTAQDHGALFLNDRGTRLTRQGVWAVLKVRCKELSLNGVTPQQIRNFILVERARRGTDFTVLRDQFGIRSESTVVQAVGPYMGQLVGIGS